VKEKFIGKFFKIWKEKVWNNFVLKLFKTFARKKEFTAKDRNLTLVADQHLRFSLLANFSR